MEDGLGNKPAWKSIWQLQIVDISLSLCVASGGFVSNLNRTPGPRWGLPSLRLPVPTLTSEPGYATGNIRSLKHYYIHRSCFEVANLFLRHSVVWKNKVRHTDAIR